MITGIEIYEFIKPNLGDVEFHGETYADEESIDNIKKYENLLYYLLQDLEDVYDTTKSRHEGSAKDINKEIKRIILLIQEKIKDMEIEN